MPWSVPPGDALREHLRANLERFPRRAHDGSGLRSASVCMVVTDDDAGRPCFVITRRPSTLRRHAGQWALPGGRVDAGESPLDAALRELHEELGLRRTPADVLGALDDYPTRSGFRITPFVVWAGRGARLRPDPQEVAEVHRVPLVALESPDVPHLSSIPESDRPVLGVPLPMLGTRINAPTAAVLYQFREAAMRGKPTRVAHFEQPVFAWK